MSFKNGVNYCHQEIHSFSCSVSFSLICKLVTQYPFLYQSIGEIFPFIKITLQYLEKIQESASDFDYFTSGAEDTNLYGK